MAHNLATIDGRYTFAYQGSSPWHKLGQRLTGNPSIDEALAAACMAFTVEARPLYLDGGTLVPSHKCTLRINDDGTIAQLGVVGKDYTIAQNREVLAIVDAMLQLGYRIAAIGALGNGERCWCLVDMGQTITPIDGDDVRGYFLVHWSHDGNIAVTGLGTCVRVVCQNTLGMALAAARRAWFSVRHTTNAAQRIDEAARLMAQLGKQLQQTGETFAQLARRQMGPREIASYIEAVIPNPEPAKSLSPTLQNRRDTIARLVFGGRGADMANQAMPQGFASAWAAYNAVTEYFDHVRPAEARSASAIASANVSAVF